MLVGFYIVVLTLWSTDETMQSGHSLESYLAVILCGACRFAIQRGCIVLVCVNQTTGWKAIVNSTVMCHEVTQ